MNPFRGVHLDTKNPHVEVIFEATPGIPVKVTFNLTPSQAGRLARGTVALIDPQTGISAAKRPQKHNP